VDSKQLVLFLIVPAVYRLARGQRARTVANVIVSVGAAAAVFGVIQYGLLGYDYLGQRPRGSLGHYMTYSGLLMLVMGLTVARVLFGKGDRVSYTTRRIRTAWRWCAPGARWCASTR
jgi:hypothetical protein